MIYYFSLILLLAGFSFSLKRKHLLTMLLSLEYLVILMFLILFFYLSLSFEYYFCMIFLTMSVCEGSLGLSILVSLVRTHGNDNFSSFNVLW